MFGRGSLPRYIAQRLLLTIPMVWLLLTLVFLLLRVAPGDPVSAAVGDRLSEEALNERRAALGLDRPLFTQYLEYLGQVAQLDFGATISDRIPVIEIIRDNGGVTLTLGIAGLLVALLIGVPGGLISARLRDSAVDTGIRLFGVITYAAPVFFVGLLAQLLFAVKLGWFPTSGIASPITKFEVQPVTHILILDAMIGGNGDAVLEILHHLVLPGVTLGLLLCGVFIRLVRVNMLQTLQTDYVEAARARGVRERPVVWRHAFRNALVPFVTILGLQIAILMSGAVLTETTFNLPGLGLQLVNYIEARDYVAVQGIISLFALVVVAISILVDIVNALIDPRVRYS
jgi:peptide/nickel transport system permease protein